VAWIRDVKSKSRQVAGIVLMAAVAFGAFAGPAMADRGDHRDRDWHHHWDGGYYRSPPVVYNRPYYNQPYYAPPPVVYGPGIGLNIHIR
jgi:hypothetical protein